jgi:hypothetical protein
MIAFAAVLRVLDQEDVMNVNVRRQLRFGAILLAITVGSVTGALAQEGEGKSGHPKFDAGDVKHAYGFSCSGTVIASDVLPTGPFAQVGQVTCDGIDTCTGTALASFNGFIVAAEVNGTYTVNSDGTGSVTYDLTIGGEPAGQLPIYFVITDKGRGIKGLPTTPGFAVTCDLKVQ